jgi:hypothetical protein
VPQPTTLPRVPLILIDTFIISIYFWIWNQGMSLRLFNICSKVTDPNFGAGN